MPKKPKYRLEALVRIKLRQKRQAEMVLARAIKALEEEKNKLKRIEAQKEELLLKKEKARMALQAKVAGGQSTIRETQSHLSFMEKLQEDQKSLEKEIEAQKENVTEAENKLKRSRRQYIDAANELNVMEKHRELWMKKQAHALSALENKQMNELGNVVHQLSKVGVN